MVRHLAWLQCVALLIALAATATASAASLDTTVQARIRAATFEVVQRKPDEGSVTYDRSLPLELIPFQERNDKYRSIGTAFAIGGNRYVTAGHVFLLGAGSQFGPLALRDAAGTIYEIDKVWKYSDREDFVVFSMRTEPKGVQPLEPGPAPVLNDAVFAVGNALGEGIVIRDGVYTSDTPEELEGEWKWLRFSAAASPGNSGGPLVDGSGRLIGVVLRRSESENLNYALPIERVMASKQGEGRIGGRTAVRLPFMDVSETLEVHDSVALPLTPAELYPVLIGETTRQLSSAQQALLAHNRERLFPNGAKSSQLLHSTVAAPFPRFVRENQEGRWVVAGEQPQSFQLDHNGQLEISAGIIRLRRPDDVTLAALYGDTKLLMDLLLHGYAVRRQVGSESVKVTSLGRAQWTSSHTDAWGRSWQINAWAEPWADTLLVAFSLPTPEGYIVFLTPVASGYRDAAVNVQKIMVDYAYLSMGGALWQWQEYLAQKNVQPKVFGTFTLEIDPARQVHFRSRRCELTVTSALVPLSRDSQLWLKLSYFRDADAVVWDVAALSVAESAQQHNWVEFWRIGAPDADLPEGFQSQWRKLQGREFPFNGMVSTTNGATKVSTSADMAGDAATAKVRYSLTVQNEGDQSQELMKPKLELLQSSFKALEH